MFGVCVVAVAVWAVFLCAEYLDEEVDCNS
jgi:hypothetical protein